MPLLLQLDYDCRGVWFKGATYALVEVVPDAIGNGVVGPVCAVNRRTLVVMYSVLPRGGWCLQLECEGGDEDRAEEHVVPADEGAVLCQYFSVSDGRLAAQRSSLGRRIGNR